MEPKAQEAAAHKGGPAWGVEFCAAYGITSKISEVNPEVSVETWKGIARDYKSAGQSELTIPSSVTEPSSEDLSMIDS